VARINDITSELMEQITKYGRLLERQVLVEAEDTARALVKDLKANSPKDSGDYGKGWRVKKSGKKWIVHNATDYQLTHLLEHGHVIRQGNGGRTPAIAHIRPAEEKAVNQFLDNLERLIQE
jgi:hypothetical protein